MQYVDWLIVGVILMIAGAAGWYIYRAKRRGAKCIGCPDGCKGGCAGCCLKEKEQQ